jgi:glucan 1,3-beta-glucosidase
VGYWYFHVFDDEPFTQDVGIYPVALDLLKTLTNTWSKELDLKVLIDLHTAPGSQNGFDNSGRRGQIELLQGDHLERWQMAISAVAEWCVKNLDSDVLFGIEVLNEPAGFDSDVFQKVKDVINPQGYQAVRNRTTDLNVVFQTAFKDPYDQVPYNAPDYQNCWFDDHSYQCFGDYWNNLALDNSSVWSKHLDASCQNRGRNQEWSLWTFVGEFSLAVTDCTIYLTDGMNGGCDMDADPTCKYKGYLDQTGHSDICEYYNRPASELSADYKQFLSKFASAQMDSFEAANGWFFWNFRTEDGHAPEWDYLLGLREGWMPKDAGARQPFCTSMERSVAQAKSSASSKICHGRSVCE